MVLGLFSSTAVVDAQTGPEGICTYTFKSRGGNISTSTDTKTEADCKAYIQSRGFTGITWTTCTYTVRSRGGNVSTVVVPGDTETQCKARPTGTWISNVIGNTDVTNPNTGTTLTKPYVLLAPLPCDSSKDGAGCKDNKLINFDPSTGLGVYLNLMIKIFIGICAVLSVVMIVTGGIEYMTSELSHTKEAGKERITHAILGLLIALGAYALLFTVNPDLLKSDINPPSATITTSSGIVTSDVSQLTGTCNDTQFKTQEECESQREGRWILPVTSQNGALGSCDYYSNSNINSRTILRDITETYCYNTLKGIHWTVN